MSGYNKIWIMISLLYVCTAGIFGINHSYWGDETHFVQTIRLFSGSSFSDSIKDYPEVTTPLVYIVYGLWGKTFGTELITLRILSLIISFAFLLMLYLFVGVYIKNEKLSLLVSGSMLINPYLWGMSVFVFTDMLTLLFIVTAFYFFNKDNQILTSLFLGLALLCRQYAGIFMAAAWFFLLLKSIIYGEKKSLLKFTLYLLISTLPFVFLVILWRGLSPPAGINKFIPHYIFYWNPHSFVAYIAFSAIYISPLIPVLNQRLLQYNKILIPAFLLGCIYFVFPAEISEVTRLQTGLDTVGLVHRLLYSLAGRGTISTIILYVFFSLGMWIIIIILKEDLSIIRQRELPDHILLSGMIYLYMIVMPFSYQVWEKYLIMILPVILLRIGLLTTHYPGSVLSGNHKQINSFSN